MPSIRPSSDLRNNYGEISEFCHTHKEPVFITRNGTGDLAVLSIEAYEQLAGKFELHAKLEKGIADIKAGRVTPAHDAFDDLESRLANGTI